MLNWSPSSTRSLQRNDAETQKLRDDIAQSMRENRRTISKLTLESMAKRSQFEGVVAEAILTLDGCAVVDDQTKQIMDGSKEWYAAYRECESPGYIGTNGGIRHMVLKERIEKFTENDELLGSAHALIDFAEQYRLKKDPLVKGIEARATSADDPSELYKSAYKEISAMCFESAGNGEDSISFVFHEASHEDIMAADERYPLFPKGSRFVDNGKEQQAEDERLFGK